MSEEQLSDFLAALQADVGLKEKLKGAADIDAAVAIVKEAGFDVSKVEWLRYQAKQTLELSDEELEGVAGGAATGIACWNEYTEQISIIECPTSQSKCQQH